MTDEHVKLVAKIQYFYDVMVRRLQSLEVGELLCGVEVEEAHFRSKSDELNDLVCEYSRTFGTFLHKEPDEKV